MTDFLKLSIKARELKPKKVVKDIRRSGDIPAVVYDKNSTPRHVTIDGTEFRTHMRHIEKGFLPTTRFLLKDEDGKEIPVIVKDIQYNIISYDVIHLDLLQLDDNRPVNVKVPLVFTNTMDCTGIKLGGVFRVISRYAQVRSLPQNIPSCLELDIKDLSIGQSMRFSKLSVPENIDLLTDKNDVAVVIARR